MTLLVDEDLDQWIEVTLEVTISAYFLGKRSPNAWKIQVGEIGTPSRWGISKLGDLKQHK